MLRFSRMTDLGTVAPGFSLPDAAGRMHALMDFAGSKAVLVAFLCNHCPFVQHILDGFVKFARDCQARGLAIVGISSNDIAAYPDDAPERMGELARSRGFPFPYLFDESQAVALAYGAICTPDFFLFDRDLRLVYRGQFDASRPRSNVPVTGADMRAAADAVLAGKSVPAGQTASAGCSIKWKAGNAPEWA